MALANLATASDLSARNITFDASTESTLVDTLLATASSVIRNAANHPITEQTSSITLEAPWDQWLKLPAGPVSSVTDVMIDGNEVTNYRLIQVYLWRGVGWRAYHEPRLVEVTYTYGYPAVPVDIVDMTCVLVASGLRASRAVDDGTGLAPDRTVRFEGIGDYQVSYVVGEDGPVTHMALPNRVKLDLAARFGAGSHVVSIRG